MKFLEKDLEDLIWDRIIKKEDYEDKSSFFSKKGLSLPRYIEVYRQLETNRGVADIVFYTDSYIDLKSRTLTVYFNVWELKKDVLTVDALSQAVRYVSSIREEIAHVVKTIIQKKIGAKIKGVYCVPSITLIGREAHIDLRNYYSMMDNLNIYTYQFSFEHGLKFNLLKERGSVNQNRISKRIDIGHAIKETRIESDFLPF